jgi:hypothetical protein
MKSITCDSCGESFKLDPSTAGKPAYVPGIGHMISVICVRCGKVLSVKLTDGTQPRPQKPIG